MAGETQLTVIGNLTNEPELRFTPSGAAVANFTVASTPSVFDKQSNSFKDGETLFMRCSVWREQAENVAELPKGTRVVAVGNLKPNSYTTKEGENRTVMVLECSEVGASLKWNPVRVGPKPQREAQGGSQGGYGGQQGANGGGWGQQPQGGAQGGGWGGNQQAQKPADDPWGPAQGGDSEPPF